MILIQKFKAISLIAGCVCLAACEVDTKATIDGKKPPTIMLSGSGGINFLRVMEEPTEASWFEKNEGGIWQIDPLEEMRGKTLWQYPRIKYGEVPPGFIQRIPKDGSKPPPLQEGKSYLAWAPTYNANGGGVRFIIREGRSVELR
jgi:hypothetical protein